MSRIYWHTQDGDEVEVAGVERHYAAVVMRDLCLAVIPDNLFGAFKSHLEHPVARHFGSTWRPVWPHQYAYSIAVHLERPGLSTEPCAITCQGTRIDGFSLLANTALRLGSDPVRLLARLHASCEIHTWVDGPNRKWLGEIIRRGRRDRILRDQVGWEEVVKLLESADDSPVVTSFSVCEQFPNRSAAGWTPPAGQDPDGWYQIPYRDRWDLSVEQLRARERQDTCWLEMRPDNWDTFHFGQPVTIMDLVEAWAAERRKTPE